MTTEVAFSSKGTKKADGFTREIALNDVKVMDGFNPRSEAHEKEIETLAASIAKSGLIAPPTVRPGKAEGEFELISGHRRYRALQSLGRTSALFVVRLDLSENAEAKAYAVAENSQDGRTDLTYVELGRAFLDFTKQGWKPQKISTKAGVHVATVRRALALMELPGAVLEFVQNRVLSESAALAYSKLPPEIQNLIPEEKLEGASIHYIKELAKQAQKEIDKGRKEAGVEGKEGEEASEAGGKKKGKVKINWRNPTERTQAIRELAHIAYNPKNEGASDAREILKTLYWVRGHGTKIGDLNKGEMDAFVKGDNEAFIKAQQLAEEKAAKKREKEAAKGAEQAAPKEAKAGSRKSKNKKK